MSENEYDCNKMCVIFWPRMNMIVKKCNKGCHFLSQNEYDCIDIIVGIISNPRMNMMEKM